MNWICRLCITEFAFKLAWMKLMSCHVISLYGSSCLTSIILYSSRNGDDWWNHCCHNAGVCGKSNRQWERACTTPYRKFDRQPRTIIVFISQGAQPDLTYARDEIFGASSRYKWTVQQFSPCRTCSNDVYNPRWGGNTSAYYNQGYIRVDWYYFARIEIFANPKREVGAGLLDNNQRFKRFEKGGKHS